MIAITGATGRLGRLVISELLKKMPPSEIIATVRNADKARDLAAKGVVVRIADYNTPSAWDATLKGVDKLLLISSSEVGHRLRHHSSVIDAAKRAGVTLLAYTSILRPETSALGLAGEDKDTESYIRTSNVPYAMLRYGWFTENYTLNIPAILKAGILYGCAGNGRVSSAARIDCAEAATAVLTRPDQAGTVYELAGDNAHTHAEFVEEISRQTGRAISYVDLTEAEYQDTLKKAGMPDKIAALIADFDTAASKGALYDAGRAMSMLINRPTTPMSASIAAALGGQDF